MHRTGRGLCIAGATWCAAGIHGCMRIPRVCVHDRVTVSSPSRPPPLHTDFSGDDRVMARTWLLAFLALGSSAKSQVGNVSLPRDSARYEALRLRIAAADTTVNFTEFRFLAARMPSLVSVGSTPTEHFTLARQTPDSLVSRAHVDSVTWLYAGHVRAHMDAQRIFQERHDTTRSRAEAAIVRRFIASIGASDGLTAATAMPVVSIEEEYAYLFAHHVRRDVQALAKCGDGECDVLTGTDQATGKSVTYYFRLTWM